MTIRDMKNKKLINYKEEIIDYELIKNNNKIQSILSYLNINLKSI